MKQSATKTLGVAALGAAFAAAGAGAATAAPELPDTAQTVDSVARTLPAETVSQVAPGAGNVLEQGRKISHTGLTVAQPVVEQVVAEQLAEGPTEPVAKLLGGVPLKGLPTQGLPVNGLPLGG
ncbi:MULTISPECIES: ATP-binding protein [Streptomyces violaceoruber group]|uniref:ATP-binding protein n=1 Tax=Streptomyces rubrogriseus TaxID=194673 RepID=A0ABT4NX24_9ACTN|nr:MULTISPECIES: ATP-binding protein [Streptomyces anthocyanicus group]MCW8118145.1 ATP-binding protein [Streptomyces anthocyanicus]MCZ4633665.1 ATP-binding protein [Streptomyces rubrogriseus]WTC10851.1 ATP-binding protein [Streptomyces anthocyanicus]